jgi:hypothetical protein
MAGVKLGAEKNPSAGRAGIKDSEPWAESPRLSMQNECGEANK